MVTTAVPVTVLQRPQVPASISAHIRFVTSLSAIMVVYIHGTTVKYTELRWQAPHAYIQSYLSHNLFHVSLLVFFFCSGFLLFLGAGALRDMSVKLRRRLRGLLVPYLLWSGLWLIVLVAVMPFADLDFGKHSDSLRVGGVLKKLLLDPVAGQLWFLRDLIVLTAVSPLFWMLPRLPFVLFLTATYLMWLWFPIPTVISFRTEWWEVVSTEALVWFLGGAITSRFLDLDWLDRALREPPIIVPLVTGAGYLLLPLAMSNGVVPDSAIFGLSTTLGFIFLASIYCWSKPLAHAPMMQRFGSFSFLIYVAHYPTLKVVALVALSVLGRSPEAALAVYLVTPWIVIAGVVVSLSALAGVWPTAVLTLNGYRPIYPFLRGRPLE